ncbi:hypothetical protein HID58_008483 [Brassica napus]|uniref:Protein kinase domain-containing protein n=2 Tax=Brassica TaxID=3705 RepID=A0ABQ8DPS3_BRANA|nr:putative inactive serine/threonine-protein kinase At5g11400 isoform X1 [Brassica napus]KAH0931366.1 hypothetical protein HID58_008483 [Brassica napus]CAG7879155.1 unnamed protein product [Brassica rapa]VDC78617.1 unnamed protein product [Brassica rapa]
MGNCLKPSKEQAPPTSPKPLNIPPIPELENENLRVFSSKEVKKLTKKFGHNRLVVDNNGFGRLFYQGYVNETTFSPSKNGTGLAVSVMHCVLHSSEELEEWKAEIRCLGKISHPSLVKLLGYCCEVKESLLVLECFHKGSLEAHIFGKEEETLAWEIRLKIAIETAQCLAFLHSVNNRALSREFGMHDIFLDEHYNAKLFYLGSNELRLFEDSISTAFIGRTDYTPPEYVISGHLGMKSDVYTFGVILIELLTGLKAFRRGVRDIKSAISVKPFLSDKNKILSIIDPRIGNDYPVNAVIQMGKLIKRCIKLDTKKRPTMQQVLDGLNDIADIKD